MIDRYENTTAAFQGGNDGEEIRRVLSEDGSSRRLSIAPDTIWHNSQITLNHDRNGYWIERIRVDGLEDDDIKDVSYLPRDLRHLVLLKGTFTYIDMGRLPRGLESLQLMGNQISKMDLRSTPPSLERLNLENNPFEEQGITLNLPLRSGLRLNVPQIGSLNLNGGFKYPVDTAGTWEVKWSDGTQIHVHANMGEVKFDFYPK